MQLKLLFDDQSSHLNSARPKPQNMDKARPFLRYPGSKYTASRFIEPFWRDLEIEEYREPFLGSGAVFFRLPKVSHSWLNDVDKDLINLFQVVADPSSRAELIKKLSDVVPSRELFIELKNWQPHDRLDRAYRYFVINRTAYSGIMKMPNWGFHPIKSVQPNKWADRLNEAGQKLQENVVITAKDYTELITKPSAKKVWLFIDPPYFKADQKRAYLHSFTQEDHLKLLKLLKGTQYRFCLTYDNCEEVKNLYSWANIYELEWRYHTANSNVTSRKIGRELIITNYDLNSAGKVSKK